MATGSFNMSTWSQVNMDAYLYEGTSASSATADYALSVSMSFADLFTSAHYKENDTNANNYDVKVKLNKTGITSALIASTLSMESVNSSITTTTGFDLGSKSAGNLLLQVMAKKIFNHPKATAAIANDTKFIGEGETDLAGIISSSLEDTFDIEITDVSSANQSSADASLDIQQLFEYCVSLGRVSSSDDTSSYVQMDFKTDDVFTFPFFLKGKLYDDDDTTTSSTLLKFYSDDGTSGKDGGLGFISNGNKTSNVNTDVTLDEGEYEIPIQLKVTLS